MQVVIFAGGLGTRISEESLLKPKPMVEIGGQPILWHILKIYVAQGFDEFVICLGYKGNQIKEYFLNYYFYSSDVTIDVGRNSYEVHCSRGEEFKVTLVETGLHTLTAGRLKRIRRYLRDEPFMLTYGDGLADIDLKELIAFHQGHGKVATVTAVQPAGRFGLLGLETDDRVTTFEEKLVGDGGWINGGFFVLTPEVFEYLPEDADMQMWEQYPLKTLAQENQLVAYKHHGFWKCMDALRDRDDLERLWQSGRAAWKIW